MAKAEDLKSYLPRYYEISRQMEAISDTEGIELDNLVSYINQTLDQFFINTASWSLDMWEQEFKIAVDRTKDQEQRRSVIISKKRGIGKATMKLIKNVAESFVYGLVDVIHQAKECQLTIKFIDNLGAPPNLQDLKQAIEKIKPAHMGVNYQYKYLLIKDIHEIMTISEMETHPLTDFAPFEPILYGGGIENAK